MLRCGKGKIMKKLLLAVFAVMALLILASCASEKETQKQIETNLSTSPDADWLLPEKIELTDEVSAVFEKAVSDLTGAEYEPLGCLGSRDEVYCILCRVTMIYPDAKPFYALVYVDNEGVRNIWDIWMGAHAEKKE